MTAEHKIELLVEIYKDGKPTGTYEKREIRPAELKEIIDKSEKQPNDDGLTASDS